MAQVDTLPPPVVGELAADSGTWARERRAFRRLMPQLLGEYRGRYVAIHNEQVAGSGDDRLEVALRVLGRIGNVPIHVGLVADEPEPVSRSGVRREVRPDRKL